MMNNEEDTNQTVNVFNMKTNSDIEDDHLYMNSDDMQGWSKEEF